MFSDDGVGLMHNFVIGSEWEKDYDFFSGAPVWREVVCAVSQQQRKNPTAALNSPSAAANSRAGTGAIIAVLSSPSGIKFMDFSFPIKAAWKCVSRLQSQTYCSNNTLACTKWVGSLLAFCINISLCQGCVILMHGGEWPVSLCLLIFLAAVSWSSSSSSMEFEAPSRKTTRHRSGHDWKRLRLSY